MGTDIAATASIYAVTTQPTRAALTPKCSPIFGIDKFRALPMKVEINAVGTDTSNVPICSFVFCLLLLRPLKRIQFNFYLLAPLIAISLSAMLETSQHVISVSRNSDIKDFIANTMGVLSAVMIYYLFISNSKWEKLF